MISLWDELPDAVVIDGNEYPVITDFREWIRLMALMKADDVELQSKAALVLSWYKEKPECSLPEAIDALSMFMRCGEKYGEGEHTNTSKSNPTFSYEHDADVIYADFMQVYGIDLLDIDYLHWWKFKALLDGLPEETEFKRRVHYRSVNLAEIQDDKERKRIAKIKSRIALPAVEITDEDIGNAFW